MLFLKTKKNIFEILFYFSKKFDPHDKFNIIILLVRKTEVVEVVDGSFQRIKENKNSTTQFNDAYIIIQNAKI